MAGDWIKMEIVTPDKPEVWQIAEILDIDPDAAFGKCFRIWAWFDQHTENGNASCVTKLLLNRVVGNADFCNAMLQVGWLVDNDGCISMPNFARHNGKSAKNRAKTNRRVAAHRKKKRESNDKCNDPTVTKSVTREEKRREENISIETTNVVSSSELQAAPEDAFITLPLNDKSEYPVTLTAITKWQGLYPAVDIQQQLRNILGWLDSNPTKRKTRRGVNKFINNWLSREQDRGGTARTTRTSGNAGLELLKEVAR